MAKFLIIDANSIINRAFYAIRPLTNNEGVHTNGVYGFLTTLLKEIDAENPDYIACAFDVSRVTFRTEIYSDYKGTRKETPQELHEQFPLLKEALNAMNIPVIEKEGYEADDIIGTISQKCSEQKMECVILTGDKDDLQLIDSYTKVKLIITKMGKTESTLMGRDEVFSKYELEPYELIDLKALMGDKSDNIPGVTGIGEVSGLNLIREYKTLENLYENIENVKESLKKKLLADKEKAFLSRKLGTIDRNVPVDTALEKYKKSEFNNHKLYEVLTYLNFSSLISKLKLTGTSMKGDIITIEPVHNVKLPIDINELYFLASDNLIYVNFNDEIYTYDVNDDYILSILKNSKISKISVEIKNLLHQGITLEGEIFDLSLMAYVCNPKNNNSSKIYDEILGVSCENILSEAYYMKKLFDKLRNEIAENELEYINAMEHELIFTLYNMEKIGVKVNSAELESLSDTFTKEIEEISRKIYIEAGEEFNINSPKQLGEILFVKLGLDTGKKTKTGYSTSSEVLENLLGTHPIIELIKEYRQITKLNSTYVEGLKAAKDENDIVHTTYKQTLTQTGRLSSTEPNLQNIPIRYPLGRKIRETIIPKNDLLIAADYSQIELRVLAHISGDENLIKAFQNGDDIHTITAQKIFNIDDVTDNMRRTAKAVNFGLIYGKGEFSLAKDLGITRKDAKEYIEKYLGQYPDVNVFMKAVVNNARETGFTKTLYNRRRYFPELNAKNHLVRVAAERAVLNTPIQGTAADIIKLAMLNVDNRLKENNFKSCLILQIHDELIIDCYENEKEEITKLLKEAMENAVGLSVPLTVSIATGKNLDDCK